MAAPKLDWFEVDSSNLEAVAYHEQMHTLCVRFQNGGLYSYEDVPVEVYYDLVGAESVGGFFQDEVKGFYSYTKWFDEAEMMAMLNRKP